MVHVILIILKILGITILVVLALILLILLLVLFVPVRCRISGDYKKDGAYLKVDMSWLWHLVLYRFVYQDCIKENNLKIFGLKMYPKDDTGKSYKKGKKGRLRSDKKTESDKTYCEKKQILGKEAQLNIEKSAPVPLKLIEETDNAEAPDEKSVFKRIKAIIENILNKIRLFFAGFTDKIKSKYTQVKKKTTDFIKTTADVRNFVQDRENLEALKDVLTGVRKLLVHMRPRKVKINGELGFEDPAVTGWVFGILGFLSSYYYGGLNVKADFEKQVIDIEFDVKGHLTVAYAVYILLRLMMNKKIRKWVFRR